MLYLIGEHPVNKAELKKVARELHAIHGLLPVPVAGKIPIGGTGWNLMPLETRLSYVDRSECTGVGIQFGLVFHPVLGPIEARCLDCDINDRQKSMLFAGHLQSHVAVSHWRWGRRPATIIFTQPGILKNEKFGPVQLLGSNKQAVWWGAYQNKQPEPLDPLEYWHEGRSIFDVLPPMVPAERLKTALETSLAAAGYEIKSRLQIDRVPLSARDIAQLTPANLEHFKADIKSMLFEVDQSPTGSGRGTRLHHLGVKYGALIKASGHAPVLMEAMREVCPPDQLVEFETVEKTLLKEIGTIAENAFVNLPGKLSAGDRRDFARGVGRSLGLGQQIALEQAKQPLLMPTGRQHAGQLASDLLQEDLPPLCYLADTYLADTGCIVIAGKPKVGKGWIILELGIGVAEGSRFWGMPCRQGDVLMYMLEDSKRRVQQRLRILRPQGFDAAERLRFRYSPDGPFFVNANGAGTLLDDIREHIRCFPKIKLVIVDVLQRVRGAVDKTDNAYQVDYKVIGALQKLAVDCAILIVVVHHTKKGKVDDAIDSINGSYGVIGAADGGIVIGKDGDRMRIQSNMRDIPDYDFDLVKEDNSPMWKPAQTALEMTAPNEGTKTNGVLLALHAAACVLTAGDLSKRTNIPENQVAAYLGRLLKNNQVHKPSRGFYMAAGLPYRERIAGVMDALKRCPKTVATMEVKNQYAPNSAPPEATYMVLTDVALKEIDAGFVNAKSALQSLKYRGLLTYNSDTVWLLGDGWDETRRVKQSNPFAFKMPWEVAEV